MDFKQRIRGIPDFPKPGILFYDISPLLADADAWRGAISSIAEAVKVYDPDVLVGVESRGFLLAAPLALELNKGFAMVRKRGKLPGDTIEYSYDLEYGSDTIELQADAVKPGQRVVILDDLLATGGTMAATVNLVRRMGGVVTGAAFLIELTFLGGREKLDIPATALMSYDS